MASASSVILLLGIFATTQRLAESAGSNTTGKLSHHNYIDTTVV